ncbi:rRNA N(6)-adenosine-methyltransferase ZCCHC4-like isoform X2 [Porites lutea]|uniref:rRNA N(6)-adenosine-methyltransferase ZCCHC4-like isoform X2 n=1 Tax=Porites lutea TaxID=51062 RepID=UPI003CC68F3A
MQSFHSAKERFGVDVCVTNEDLTKAPECPHGPMLLFERFFKDGRSPRRFYACSASRDRKDCSFFQWEEEKISEARKKAHKEIIKKSRLPFIEACHKYQSIFESLDNLQRKKCLFCHSCGLLFMPKEKGKHCTHECEQAGDLRKPTVMMRPRENEKTQAQYFFSRKATKFIASLFEDLGFKNVLCVGTPRLHEEIQCSRQTSDGHLDSLLMDVDFRYAQFFPSSKFCLYNMFNHFFFESVTSEKVFQDFLRREGLVLVMDPPFGGLAEVLAHSVKIIWDQWRKVNKFKDKELPTLWIFPYFMEPHVKAALPSLTMLDYKVDYDNHPHFKSKNMKGSKRGSPVRIFTNINAADIVLPAEEGYRFCKSCNRYVAPENIHCRKCNGCMSKDGRQYVHCEMCGKCVKPGLEHCMTCDRCELKGHACKRSTDPGACHICGELGHKRRDCPTRLSELPKKRRKKKQHPGGDETGLGQEKLPKKKKLLTRTHTKKPL